MTCFSYCRNHLIKKYNLVKALIDQDTNCVLKVADSNILPIAFSTNSLDRLIRVFGYVFRTIVNRSEYLKTWYTIKANRLENYPLPISCYFYNVENTGFEPVTFCMPCKRASQLRQSPIIFQRQRYTFFLNLPNLFLFFSQNTLRPDKQILVK